MFNKAKARLEILSYVCQICLSGHSKNFKSSFDIKPKSGDLVAIRSCEPSKWYLSWYKENIGEHHILESIEDGTLCKWSNVSFLILDSSMVQPHWLWDDKQYEFHDKWQRACKKAKLYPLYRGTIEFIGSYSVKLEMIEKWTNKVLLEQTFEDYGKILTRDMLSFLDKPKVANHESNR